MFKFPYKSERQWAISFLSTDLSFWLLMLGGCIFDAAGCGVGLGFAVAGFYAPFGIFTPLFGDTYMREIISMGVVGLLVHFIAGWTIGWILRKRRVSWRTSIAASFGIVIATTIIINTIYSLTGAYI